MRLTSGADTIRIPTAGKTGDEVFHAILAAQGEFDTHGRSVSHNRSLYCTPDELSVIERWVEGGRIDGALIHIEGGR